MEKVYQQIAGQPAIAPSPYHSTTPLLLCSLSSLSLHHFRNYVSAQLELSSQPVVLTGHNGAGKTNILEAISLLMPGRGLRRAALSDMDHIPSFTKGKEEVDTAPWVISTMVNGIQGEAQIGTGRDSESEEDRRVVKIDGKVIRSQAELAKHISVVWLTPQMEHLFHEGPSGGRKFLDRLVYGFDPEHASRINEYEFAMRERNKLLATGGGDSAWLDALEQTMAETGAAIAAARLSAAEHINHAAATSTLSFPKAAMSVHGLVEDQFRAGKTALEVENAFRKELSDRRFHDAGAGRALEGPHRSMLQVIHTAKHAPAWACSTGEQKALLLSIVLAQARAGVRWKGVVPLLLLDEVAAHLDATRRLELFEEICQIGAQVWMTGTDVKLFDGLEGKAQYFEVQNGRVSERVLDRTA